ncbi:MAG TPA: hypothetical protein PLF40_02945 [Kofleriaceae bacterium]|nr:hypothetical protein [Kofleriaceae bacterium]
MLSRLRSTFFVRTSTSLAAFAALALSACGDNHAAAIDAAPATPTPRCQQSVAIPRATFITESVSYLRTTFGGTGDFTGGTVRYSEMWVDLDDNGCKSDFSALWYVAPISNAQVPTELRGKVDHVAAVWTLNGLRGVVYLASPQTKWQAGSLPDESIHVVRENASPANVAALVRNIQTAHPSLAVQWLDAIGVLTLTARISEFADPTSTEPTWQVVEAATQQVRASNLFSSTEWSSVVFRLPNADFPAINVTDDVLYPECLRVHTKSEQAADAFTTLPSLRQPLGLGPVDNPNACR